MQDFLIKLIHTTTEIHISLKATSLEDAIVRGRNWLDNNFSFETFGYTMECEAK